MSPKGMATRSMQLSFIATGAMSQRSKNVDVSPAYEEKDCPLELGTDEMLCAENGFASPSFFPHSTQSDSVCGSSLSSVSGISLATPRWRYNRHASMVSGANWMMPEEPLECDTPLGWSSASVAAAVNSATAVSSAECTLCGQSLACDTCAGSLIHRSGRLSSKCRTYDEAEKEPSVDALAVGMCRPNGIAP
ncbi:hypothetical protein DQ04_01261040 [Trypanosoma grayi]|uniref:hypothetical protein n=1 Tax=Trypanosoma grayi TaxID=71804 RepID=UPI0004F41B7A|nr:hypothetical protein DQ04_01261040 [Trypanosoma grayi]KEG13023.1 hypothetical protein DQ04_01261040 [Trypanosoma grayi]